MRRFLVVGGLAILLLAAPTAHAEFQVSGSAGGIELHPMREEEALTRQRPVMRRLIAPVVTQGFGRQVPLSFAIRQVVPKGVAVSFPAGSEIDDYLVDWQGGRPWQVVLRGLLRPVGLEASFRPRSVQIKRRSA